MYTECKLKIENTLKFEIFTTKIIKTENIINYLKEFGINFQKIIGYYESESKNEIFVKFIDTKSLEEYYDGIKCKENKFKVSKVENLTEVKLKNIPFEIGDEIVTKKLLKYGSIKEIKWQKIKINETDEIYDGIRIAYMVMKSVIPPLINICNVNVRVFYQDQKLMCHKCMSTTHHRNKCTYNKLHTNTDTVKDDSDSSTLDFVESECSVKEIDKHKIIIPKEQDIIENNTSEKETFKPFNFKSTVPKSIQDSLNGAKLRIHNGDFLLDDGQHYNTVKQKLINDFKMKETARSNGNSRLKNPD